MQICRLFTFKVASLENMIEAALHLQLALWELVADATRIDCALKSQYLGYPMVSLIFYHFRTKPTQKKRGQSGTVKPLPIQDLAEIQCGVHCTTGADMFSMWVNSNSQRPQKANLQEISVFGQTSTNP